MNKIISLLFLSGALITFGQIPTPVDYYPFTNGSITGLTQNGTAMTQTTDRINSATDAVRLNGDYLTRPTFNYQNISVSFWVNTTTIDANMRTIINQSSGGKGWAAYLKNGKAGFAGSYEHGQQVNGVNQQFYTGYSYIESTTNIADGQWHNVIVTAAKSIYFDGAGWVKSYVYKLYVDGVQENATTVIRGSSGSNTNVYADLCWNIPVSVSVNTALKYTDAIDDIRFYGSVVDAAGIAALSNENNCVTAQDVQFNPTTNSVTVSWDPNPDAVSWDAVIVPQGANINTGTPVNGIINPSHTFTGLDDNTAYDVYIRANCSGFSGWYGLPQTFTTVCLSTSVTAVAQNVNLVLDANGEAMITAAGVNNGSLTSCGIPAAVSIDNNFFDCSHIGANTVTLTATDGFGNSATATATVNVMPQVLAQNIQAYLDASGNVTVDPAAVDNGTNSQCSSNLNFSLSQSAFDCSDLGANNVVLTADNGQGVSGTANAIITVSDTLVPLVVTQNISLSLDAFFTASLTPEMLDNGSSDNCSSSLSFVASKTEFTCEDQGVNEVTLTVTDENGNSASALAYVTVQNLVADQAVTAAQTNFCNNASASTTISTASSENGVKYYLRDADNNIIDGPLNGNGSALTFNTGTITTSETYHVYGEKRAAVLNSFALDFDGVNDVVHTTLKMPLLNTFTIEAWVFPRSANYDRFISNYTNGAAGQFVIDTYTAPDNGRGLRLYFVGPGNTPHSVSVANALQSNAWNHIACTFDAGLVKLYVDGVEVASSMAPFSSFPAHANAISFGEDPVQGGAAEYLNGKMDDIRFWNYARSQQTIDAEKFKCLSGIESGLFAFYDFEEGSGNSLTDLVGGKNGTLTNMDPATDWLAGAYICQNYCGSEMSEQITVSLGQTYSQNESATVCSGSSYTFPDGTTENNITADLVHTSTLQTINACDSVIVTTVTVKPSYSLTETVSLCAGSDYTFPDGTVTSNIQADLLHTSTLQTTLGCDSMITTDITILPVYDLSETIDLCSGSDYTFHDGILVSNITVDLTHTSILQSSAGCDSTIVSTIHVLPVYQLNQAVSLCSGSDYTFPDGTTELNILADLVHTSTLQTLAGCDSIILTNIAIHPVYNLNETVAVCDGSDYTFPDGTVLTGITTQVSHTSNLQSQAGCDSIIVTTVNVNPVYSTAEQVFVCSGSSYTFADGFTESLITAQVMHTSTLQSQNGCDSIVVTTVEVNPVYSSTEQASLCPGASYTFPDGTIENNITADLSHTSILQSMQGCDSIIVSNITVLPGYELTENASLCPGLSYTFPDGTVQDNITQSLTHNSIFATVNGCDSIIVTNLVVLPAYNLSETVPVCNGSSYTFPDGTIENNITATIVHTSAFVTLSGCDSTITTTVEPGEINTAIDLQGNTLSLEQNGASYQWIDCADGSSLAGENGQNFIPVLSGSYACVISLNACSDTTACVDVELVGLLTQEQENWKVYPNPTNDLLFVSGVKNLKYMTLYSLSGDVIQFTVTTSLSLEKLPAGSYLLEISDGNKQVRQLVVKQ